MIGENMSIRVAEDESYEVKRAGQLMDVVLLEILIKNTKEICVKECNDCKINHGSQKQHSCIMWEEDEQLSYYGVKELKYIFEENILEKAYKEAERVMKFQECTKVWEHYEELKADYDNTLCYLGNIKDEMKEVFEPVRNHIYFWMESNI